MTAQRAGIADYVFVDHLYEGNHGDYWLARPPERLNSTDSYVMVKTLGTAASEEDFKRMANELRVYAAADSDRLVRVYDAGQQDGELFYASEYFADGSLESPARPLDRDELLSVVADAAMGAHALHEVGVAHRDIKPANVMISGTEGRLGDLGLSQVLNPGQTVTGLGPIGTLDYLAPETVRGESAGRASDVWAIGAVLHRALTGRAVFPQLVGLDLLEALRVVLHERPTIAESLHDNERAIIERCLEQDPADRFETAADLAEAINATKGSA
jgi:serine/threonine protein kinase